MNKQTERVLALLSAIATSYGSPLDAVTKELIADDIDRKREKGWTDDEIISYIRCCEEITPQFTEEYALKRMRQISRDIAARLLTEA